MKEFNFSPEFVVLMMVRDTKDRIMKFDD